MSQPIPALSARLITLTDSLKQTQQLIHRLSTFQSTSTSPITNNTNTSQDTASQQPDDATQADLAAEIHDALTQHEEELELLKLDVEDVVLPTAPAHGRRGVSKREAEREREGNNLHARCARLTEDIAVARTRFRKAQLQAKRNADQALTRERADYLTSLQETAAAAAAAAASASQPPSNPTDALSHPDQRTLLFSSRRTDGAPRGTTTPTNSATSSSLILTATSDLTTSLRRTHALLTSELSRSQFAHETLSTSNAALAELNTRYTALDDVLARSKGLLGTLMSSQKSDSWYLQTAVYILVGTVVWLLFRRLVYGPAWWLIWFPMKTGVKVGVWTLKGAVGGVAWTVGGAVSGAVAVVKRGAGVGGVGAGGNMVPNMNATTELLIATTSTINAQSQGRVQVQASVSPTTASPTEEKQEHEEETMTSLISKILEASSAMSDYSSSSSSSSSSTADPPLATVQPAEGSQQQGRDAQAQAQAQAQGQAGAGAGAAQQNHPPIIRADGQPLRQRDPVAEPANPKKRMWEEPPAPPAPPPQREL